MTLLEETEPFTIPYGRNNYCGPCALAYVLGSDPDGVKTRLAFPIGPVPRPQLRSWLATREDPAALYIVNITHHYIVVHGDQMFDNRFHLGKPLEKCPYLLRRVVNAWMVLP